MKYSSPGWYVRVLPPIVKTRSPDTTTPHCAPCECSGTTESAGLYEDQRGGRTSQEPERDVAKRMVCFWQATDDVRESGHSLGNPTRFMKMAHDLLRMAGTAQPP